MESADFVQLTFPTKRRKFCESVCRDFYLFFINDLKSDFIILKYTSIIQRKKILGTEAEYSVDKWKLMKISEENHCRTPMSRQCWPIQEVQWQRLMRQGNQITYCQGKQSEHGGEERADKESTSGVLLFMD